MFKHIDPKIKTDSGITNFTYYTGKDILGRKWEISRFSLSGIWIMNCISHKCRRVYANSLQDADTLLGGGTVKVNRMEKTYIDDDMQEHLIEKVSKRTSVRW